MRMVRAAYPMQQRNQISGIAKGITIGEAQVIGIKQQGTVPPIQESVESCGIGMNRPYRNLRVFFHGRQCTVEIPKIRRSLDRQATEPRLLDQTAEQTSHR
jgi:hypothetical protein